MAIQRQDNKQTGEATTLKALQISGKALPKPVKKSTAITQVVDKPNVGGRPTSYNPETANYICAELAQGRSLRSVLLDEGMPVGQTVFSWLRTFPEFLEQYARAKEESADSLADDIQDIADKTLRSVYDPQAARVAIDAYKWTASKLKPKKYGDKLDMTTNGKDLPMPILSLDYTNKED